MMSAPGQELGNQITNPDNDGNPPSRSNNNPSSQQVSVGGRTGRPRVELLSLAMHADFMVVGMEIIVFDVKRGQIIYMHEKQEKQGEMADLVLTAPYTGEKQEEQGKMVDLVLTGPYTGISASGCFAIKIDIPRSDDPIEWEWDGYDLNNADQVDALEPRYGDITRAADNRKVGRVTYAVMSNAVEATVQVKLRLNGGEILPIAIVGKSEITAVIQDFKDGSVLLSSTQRTDEWFSSAGDSWLLLQLARNVVAVPCGRVLQIKVNLQIKTSNDDVKPMKVVLYFANGIPRQSHKFNDGEVEANITWYPEVNIEEIGKLPESSHQAQDGEASIRNLLKPMQLDENVEPTNLSIDFLQSITNNFSEDQEIDSGLYANVYKGLIQNGTVAVKKRKLNQVVELQEAKFTQEVDSLTRVKHKNIVRCLGYCFDTPRKLFNYRGKRVMVEEPQMLLCLEFLPKGNLNNYISDASRGLEWRTRYQIIRGICEGLHYLHKQNIVHSDLNPTNILLDHGMVPKIAGFGFAKFSDQTQAIRSDLVGTLGYMAPELFSGGVTTFKSDIYSLGITIIRILTGQDGYLKYLGVDNVVQCWSTRFQTSKGGTWLQHVEVCAEIGLDCIDDNPVNRPDMRQIISNLEELEQRYGDPSATHVK